MLAAPYRSRFGVHELASPDGQAGLCMAGTMAHAVDREDAIWANLLFVSHFRNYWLLAAEK